MFDLDEKPDEIIALSKQLQAEIEEFQNLELAEPNSPAYQTQMALIFEKFKALELPDKIQIQSENVKKEPHISMKDDPEGHLEQIRRAHYSWSIKYPIVVSEIKHEKVPDNTPVTETWSGKCGDLVKIRPVSGMGNDQTFLGIFLGDLGYGSSASYNKERRELTLSLARNPAIFVPELNRIVFGHGSWWTKIDSIDDFKEISMETIQNIWYVKMLKSMSERKIKAQEELDMDNHDCDFTRPKGWKGGIREENDTIFIPNVCECGETREEIFIFSNHLENDDPTIHCGT